MKKRQKLLTRGTVGVAGALIPEPKRRRDGRGRPWASNRACFEGILWILQTGAAWRFLTRPFFPRLRLAGEDCSNGKKTESGWKAWRRFLGCVGCRRTAALGRELFRRQFCARLKKGLCRRYNQAWQRHKVDWYWSMVKVFRWEFGWKVPLRMKLRLRKPRSPKSGSRSQKVGPAAKSPNG